MYAIKIDKNYIKFQINSIYTKGCHLISMYGIVSAKRGLMDHVFF